MKKIISILMVAVIFLSINMQEAFAMDLAFIDVGGHWALGTINKWKDKGVLTGYPDGTFKPDNPVTRAELATILTLAFDLQESGSLEPSTLDYNDIDGSEWYYTYLEYSAQYIPVYGLPTLYETNLPYANNDGGFLPECNAMRMHVVEALVKIKMEKENLTIDIPSISEVHASLQESFNDIEGLLGMTGHSGIPGNQQRMLEYSWLAMELGIVTGDTDGYFRPYGEITRAELLTMIDKVLS